MKKALAGLGLGIALAVPAAAFGQTVPELQARVAFLLEYLGSLQAVRQATATTTESAPPIACTMDALLCPDGTWVGRSGPSCEFSCPGIEKPRAAPSLCLLLSRDLRLNSEDAATAGEVSALQSYLARDPAIYPEGRVTGFFGPATERAVKRWQTAYGVVSLGAASTTGFGRVGPKTRFALQHACESVSVVSNPQTATLPTQAYFAAIDVASLLSGSSSPVITGTAGGLSAVKLAIRSGDRVVFESGELPVVERRWSVRVSPPLASGLYTVDVSSPLGTPLATGGMNVAANANARSLFSVSPVAGVVPFEVSFSLLSGELYNSYTVDFGDGQSAPITGSLKHTYVTPRSFTAKLVKTGTSCAFCQDWTTSVVGSVVIEGRAPAY